MVPFQFFPQECIRDQLKISQSKVWSFPIAAVLNKYARHSEGTKFGMFILLIEWEVGY